MNVSMVSVSRRAVRRRCGHVDAQERLVVVERIVAAARVVDRLGQQDRQVLVRDRDDAVGSGSR